MVNRTQSTAPEEIPDPDFSDLPGLALASSPDAILVLDSHGTILFANRPIPGGTNGPMVGKGLMSCIPAGWSTPVGECLEQAVQSGEEQHFEVVQESDALALQGWITLMRESNGNVLFLLTVRDTSAQWQHETQLQVSADRYRFLTETISDVIWTMDLDQRITYVSPSIQPLIGYAVEAM